MPFRPKFITFDCHGTMIFFDMAGAARDLYGALLAEPRMAAFIKQLLGLSPRRGAGRLEALRRSGPQCAGAHLQAQRRPLRPDGRQEDLRAVPTWGPHAGRSGRSRQGRQGISAGHPVQCDERADHVQCREARRAVPRCLHRRAGRQPTSRGCSAFEYMFDALGCGPEDILHVSSSFRYDLMSAHDLGIKPQGLGQPRPRAGQPLLRLYRDRRHLRPCRAWSGSETCRTMKFVPYWHDTAPAFAGGAQTARSRAASTSPVIGGGFTGLAAARRLAQAGREVVVLEAERVGAGALGAQWRAPEQRPRA